ncbi:IS1/IS1595 family N-terminal zinc-binding domain-containing protein [Deinococcus hopiensis]|uniref:InsA N-terminal domain-containing protein n=1 Tax=Deinococcus hopiensis KR-140 TaxID=695939 RepID=A0A1W1UBN5_9DEIO|nr:hypothetical protein SAMN00790413_06690 [Deinococcus hopiensis KR-140]
MPGVSPSINGPGGPQCSGVPTVRNGHAHTGKQRYRCRECRRQVTLEFDGRRISSAKEAEVNRLCTERLSHRGICQTTGASHSWFLHAPLLS